jgi:hypothetical protein
MKDITSFGGYEMRGRHTMAYTSINLVMADFWVQKYATYSNIMDLAGLLKLNFKTQVPKACHAYESTRRRIIINVTYRENWFSNTMQNKTINKFQTTA